MIDLLAREKLYNQMFYEALYLLRVLPGPVDVVTPGDDDGKLVIDKQNNI